MFKELFTEDVDLNLSIIKELNKRFKPKKTPVIYKKDFKPTDEFEMNTKNGKAKILYNDKDYNRPVFYYEWI